MKAPSAALQGGLALAGLVAAYVTWQRPKDSGKSESVVVVDASKNSLERVRYEDGTRAISVEKKDRLLVTLEFLPGKRPVIDAGETILELDGGIDGGTTRVSSRPAEPSPDRTVYANDRADTLWTKLTPFEGTRALGTLAKEKLEEVGLTNSERKLELEVSGVKRRFTISRPISASSAAMRRTKNRARCSSSRRASSTSSTPTRSCWSIAGCTCSSPPSSTLSP